jgi:hypothetical protein
VLQKLMDFDIENRVGAGRYERSDARTTQRNGYRERELETRLGTLELKNPEAAQRQLFPRLPGAAQDRRAGACRCHSGSLDSGRLDAQGRRSGAGDGHVRHFENSGFETLRGHRRAGELVPRPQARRRMALSLVRRHLSQGARKRPDRLGRCNNSLGGQRRRAPRRHFPCCWRPCSTDFRPAWSPLSELMSKDEVR